MNRKITFQNMSTSEPLEQYANEKLNKIMDLLKEESKQSPFYQEVWLKANSQHPHHRAEIHVKTSYFDLNTHAEDAKMYVALDKATDKMIKLIKKEKEKLIDKNRKIETNKTEFASDKYKLS